MLTTASSHGRATCPTCHGALTCPQCAGTVTYYPHGAIDEPRVRPHPTRDERPRYIRTPAPFVACDCCEWTARTAHLFRPHEVAP